jgi:hypothetical protein
MSSESIHVLEAIDLPQVAQPSTDAQSSAALALSQSSVSESTWIFTPFFLPFSRTGHATGFGAASTGFGAVFF